MAPFDFNIFFDKLERSLEPEEPGGNPDYLSSYVVLDLETTGFSPYEDEILEMAALRVIDGVVVDSCSYLIRSDAPIEPKITKITGITNEMLTDAPRLDAVLPSFLFFLGSDTIIGHNVTFDLRFLSHSALQLFDVQYCPAYIDTLTVSRRLFPGLPGYRLCDLAAAFSIAPEGYHRALADVYTTHACYQFMARYIREHDLRVSRMCPVVPFTDDPSDVPPSAAPPSHGFHYHGTISSRSICATVTEFDTSSPLYGKTFVFTGELSMSREEAMQAVVDHGGKCAGSVSGRTDFLVVGRNEYKPDDPDFKSTKQKKAELLIQSGACIRILSENDFCGMLEVSHV